MADDFGPVTEEHRLTYQANVELAVQQMASELDMGFTFHTGMSGRTAKLLDLIGSTEARVNPPRGGDTPDIEGSHEQTWLSPIPIDWGKTIEAEDAIKALTDYQSGYVQSGAAAVMRAKDTVRANAIFGNRKTGQDGNTTTAWDNTGKVVAKTVGSADGATDTGMNVRKILRAFRLLETLKVKITAEPLVLALDPIENEELYMDLTFVSKDYRNRAVFEEKRVTEILGVPILPTTYVADYDATTSRAGLWSKNDMHEGEFMAVTTQIQRNPAKRYRPHPYIETWFGATRGEGKKLIEIHNQIPT